MRAPSGGRDRQVLAVDLGGTKALLGLFAPGDRDADVPRGIHERRLACAEFDGFEALLAAYLERARADGALGRVGGACIGLAGPVDGERARLTNRPWEIDAARIATMLAGAGVLLVNDFAAAAAGIEALDETALRTVQQAQARAQSPRLVLGPGTGLGTALLVPGETGWRVLPGEGGHAAFAPRDEREIGLWRRLAARHDRVVWEHVVSGPGIEEIYSYLCETHARAGTRRTSRTGPSAARISQAAMGAARSSAVDPDVASAALDMFASAFGAFAGDAALFALAHGGVYLAGGIAAKIFDERRTRLFVESFGAKGSHRALMPGFPVRLVLEPRVGLLGAALIAARQARRATPE